MAPQAVNLVAARICVSQERDLYALGFGAMTGPGGAPEPQIAHWVPTTPLFDLEQSAQAELNRRNISAVAAPFARHGCALTTRAYIEVLDPEGAWTVQDSPWAYHVYRCGGALEVYSIPA